MAATAPPIASICASSARAPVLQLLDLAVDRRVAVEQVVVFQKVGLIGQDLLHPQRPLLVPGAGQAQRLVPGGQLHGARAGLLRQRDRQHLDQDAVDVVLGLLLGQAEAVDLHAVAEAAVLRVRARRSGAGRSRPTGRRRRASCTVSVTKRMPAFTKKRDAAHHVGEVVRRHLALQVIQHRAGGGQRKGQFLLGRRPGLLQVVGADVHRVPFRQVRLRVGRDVGDHPQRGLGRADVGAAATDIP